MGLATFIGENKDAIISSWAEFAHLHIPPAKDMDEAALRDHVSSILEFIVADMRSAQTKSEQQEKSKGEGPKADGPAESAAEIHADLRFIEGFDPLELMSEFRALRGSILRLWESKRGKTENDYPELVRFNESIDQVLAEGLARYTEKVDHSRNLFLGTLVHDLRNPLGTVSLAAQILSTTKNLDARQKMLTEQIYISTTRVAELVTDLIDDVRARLGKGVPIETAPMDMGKAVALAMNEMRMAYPERKFSVNTTGDLRGEWDGARISQVLSNLIGNAVQHGKNTSLIQVTATGEDGDVLLSVHNDGDPIASGIIASIFKPMSRGSEDRIAKGADTSLGLGLFITREIIEAHGGKIDVSSTAQKGTTFTVRLPRAPAAKRKTAG